MDSWMGNNQDPITLHKYLYAYSDPANVIDPSGNAGLFGFSVAQNINAVLVTTSIASTGYDAYLYGSGQKEASASNLGMTALVLMGGPVAGKAIGLLSAARAAKVLDAAVKSGNIAKLFVQGGRTSSSTLRRFIPSGAKNTFKPSGSIKSGYKYQFKVGGVKFEVKWHSPDLNAAKKFPGSNSGSMWTAQIKVKKKLIGADGKLYSKPNNETHIPIDIF